MNASLNLFDIVPTLRPDLNHQAPPGGTGAEVIDVRPDGASRSTALARAEGVAERVRYVPFVPEDEMLRLVASADVGVVPTEPNSVGNALGLANKFFESMMVGLPMVASATPAVKNNRKAMRPNGNIAKTFQRGMMSGMLNDGTAR